MSDKFFRPWAQDKPFALPIRSIGDFKLQDQQEDNYCWDDWERDCTARWPIRYYLFDRLPSKITSRWNWWVIDPIWSFKHRFIPKHKYHLMKTGLKPGYYDPSTQMLHSWMYALEEFIKITEDTVEWDNGDPHKEAKGHFDKVYAWWKNYPNRQKEIEDAYSLEYEESLVDKTLPDGTVTQTHVAFDLEAKLDEEANEMLCILAKYRGFLWYP